MTRCFFDTFRGIGYHLQNDAGLYVEHSLGVNPGRSDRNSGWREGSDKLKGMGKIDPSVNTTLTVGWALTPWLQLEGAATLPLSDSQGGQYRTALTVIPFQSSRDTLVVQSAALFGDARYMNRFYGVNREQSARWLFPLLCARRILRCGEQSDMVTSVYAALGNVTERGLHLAR